MIDLRIVAALVLLAAPAAAQDAGEKASQPPQAYEALLRCQNLSDGAERLACFDQAAAAMKAATERRELVIVDRQQVRKTRRTLFGLSLPDFDDIFGGGGGDDEADEVESIETTVTRVSRDPTGKWVLRLAEGATWRQTDDRSLGRWPRAGSKIVINRGMMGSYMAQIDGQAGIRVRRDQ